jgi:hypothetical protein
MLERPHIEFIQAQLLPWRRIGPLAARPDAEFKFLSRDPHTGGCSALIRYPPGWRREGDEHIDADEELYVLDGGFSLNGIDYGFDTYAFLPTGFTRSAMECRSGAVVLSFFSREPALFAGTGHPDPSRTILKRDVLHMPWDMALNDPKLAHLGISRKDLRLDPQTGERTFLSMILPHSDPPGSAGPQERHPVVEEAYMLAGSLTGPHGTMEPGAYFWRPPGIAHGPFGTRWGAVLLVRFIGGRHVNNWTDEDALFSFAAPYRPVLPAELAAFAHAPWVGAPRY